MCFGNKKKKPTEKGSSIRKSKSKLLGVSNASGAGDNPRRSRKSEASVGAGSQTKSISKSVVKDETIKLGKSSVKIREVRDPGDIQLFPNCRTEKIEISAVSNEHRNYVRREDYFKESFDISVHNEEEPELAQYDLASIGEIATPAVNKFFYDRSGVSVQR